MCSQGENNLVPASTRQADAWRERALPGREELAPDVWALAMPIPGGALPYTFCYALLDGTGGVHLVDPGWDSEDNLTVLEAELNGLGRSLGDVRTVLATHFHPDHLGLAPRLRELTGATVILSRVEQEVLARQSAPEDRTRRAYQEQLSAWGVPTGVQDELLSFSRMPFVPTGFRPDRTVEDGEIIEVPGHRLEVVLTPGHTSGHLCLADRERGVLYAGDHVLPVTAPGVGLGTVPDSDPLEDYIGSLERVGRWSELLVLPGHEYSFRGLKVRTGQLIEHQLNRTRELADLLAAREGDSIWQYATRMRWSGGGWERVRGFFLDSALRQTDMHRRFIRSSRWAALCEKET